MRKISTQFKPGVSGNPKGRGKGVLNKTTVEYRKVRALAAANYEEMFIVLLEKGLAGEAWAQQLYYKEFIPKKAKEDIVTIAIEDKTAKGQLVALTEALANFDELTHSELVDRIKTLSAVRLSDHVGDNIDMIESREELREKVRLVEELISAKTNQSEDEE